MPLHALDAGPWLDLWSALSSSPLDLAPGAILAESFTPTRFLGRLHPILVHFPIALVTVAALAEASRIARRIESLSPLTLPLLVLGAVAAVAATGAGWLNAAWEHGGETGDTLARHRWMGTIVSAGLVVLAIYAWRVRRADPLDSATLAQRFGVLLSAAIVGLVAHLGGELVYGEGYFWKGLIGSARERSDEPPAPITGTPAEVFYLAQVKPLFVGHCAECHGAAKQKGGLRLDPVGMAFDGPASDWTIIAGFPGESELVKRLLLPRDDADAMPPEGKDPLTDDQIELIRRWILDGAVVPASERTAGSSTRASAPAPEREPVAAASPVAPGVAKAIERCLVCGAIALPIHEGAALYDLNASHASPRWTDAELTAAFEAAEAIASLNLARSAVTSAGFAEMPPMPSLASIRLDDTAFGDAGIAPLLAQRGLVSANLVGTQVSDTGLLALMELPSLREVYVWRSRVTEAGLAAARDRRPDVRVVGSEAPAE